MEGNVQVYLVYFGVLIAVIGGYSEQDLQSYASPVSVEFWSKVRDMRSYNRYALPSYEMGELMKNSARAKISREKNDSDDVTNVTIAMYIEGISTFRPSTMVCP